MISALGDAAKVVNSFNSEAAQLRALDAILAALEPGVRGGTPAKPSPAEEARGEAQSDRPGDAAPPARRAEGQSKRRHPKVDPKIDPDLAFAPQGVESLKEFYARCQPTNKNEQVLTIAYWLLRVANLESIGQDQIYSCFKHLAVRVPVDLSNKISQTGTMGWLKDRKRENVTLSIAGEEYVEHTLLNRQRKDAD